MLSKTHIFSSAVLFALLPSSSVLADVVAQDVWKNLNAHASAFGGTLTANLEETDTGLTITQVTYHVGMSLPAMGANNSPTPLFDAKLQLPDLTLVNKSDGTVSISVPASTITAAQINFPEMEQELLFEMQMASNDLISVAAGKAGEVTYTTSATTIAYSGDFVLPEALFEGAQGDSQVSMQMETHNVASVVTITEGAVLKMTSNGSIGVTTMHTETRSSAGDGMLSIQKSTTHDQKTRANLSLPTENLNLFNLADALDRGLELAARVTSGAASQVETVTLGEEVISQSDVSAASSGVELAFTNQGFSMAMEAEEAHVSAEIPMLLPTTLSGSLKEAAFSLALPLRKLDTAGLFEYSTRFVGAELDDSVWALFDPSGALPHDPAMFEMDVTGTVTSKVEWLNLLDVPDAMSALGGELPFEPENLTIKTLALEAAGAKLRASGAFTFDVTDLKTYGGIPRPDGQIEVDIQGLNALLDTLISMGLVADSDAMGARMMLATVTKAVGEDHLTSKVEMSPEGHVLANGNRLK
ncbi:DUF2125 domain-containing protein [uncultured Shimia sp.]|uniref:DUF2125 domain-containing protein n=1 Tax=uncultured Shimia sp. TaxID=573152 RepID=UPI0025E73EDD|nr:DUF2125 domain-containing protein [uncultured Shimia sp.]